MAKSLCVKHLNFDWIGDTNSDVIGQSLEKLLFNSVHLLMTMLFIDFDVELSHFCISSTVKM